MWLSWPRDRGVALLLSRTRARSTSELSPRIRWFRERPLPVRDGAGVEDTLGLEFLAHPDKRGGTDIRFELTVDAQYSATYRAELFARWLPLSPFVHLMNFMYWTCDLDEPMLGLAYLWRRFANSDPTSKSSPYRQRRINLLSLQI